DYTRLFLVVTHPKNSRGNLVKGDALLLGASISDLPPITTQSSEDAMEYGGSDPITDFQSMWLWSQLILKQVEDALIFHLTKDTEFKIYVVKAPDVASEQETDDDEEECQEVLARKRNARLKIMIQEKELFKLRNDSIRKDYKERNDLSTLSM
ncbi:hypothetical protein MKW92_017408, partial [Papaver armeniacum]